jgi:hypothetical protein
MGMSQAWSAPLNPELMPSALPAFPSAETEE